MTPGVLKKCRVTRFSGYRGDAGFMVGLDDLGALLYGSVLPYVPCAQQGQAGLTAARALGWAVGRRDTAPRQHQRPHEGTC